MLLSGLLAAAALATATIKGKVTMTICTGGIPPSSPAQAKDVYCPSAPYVETFAVVRPLAEKGTKFELVTYATSNADGIYSVTVPPGRYMIVTKFAVTRVPADDHTPYNQRADPPFTVAPGQTVVHDIGYTAPSPPGMGS
jgi:hypothetical protein